MKVYMLLLLILYVVPNFPEIVYIVVYIHLFMKPLFRVPKQKFKFQLTKKIS
jgi:hypothetical protein